MNTFSIALKNLKDNFSLYTFYLTSVSLVIAVFFAFTSFSMNNVMLEKISGDSRVESMCKVVSVFLMAFVIFYMSYSNRFFLRRRTRELGIYALLGYRKSAILSLLIVENILIYSCALFFGLAVGAVFHKGIVYGITVLLDLSIDNSKILLFNPDAVIITIGFIILVILAITLSNAHFLFKSSLMDLVQFDKSAEERIKFRKVPALLGFILTLSDYVLALDIFRGSDSLWITVGFYQTGLLTFILNVLGIILFITFFLPFAVQKSKQNKKTFYTETNIINTPNFIYRIRSNSKVLIILTLLSATTLTISSVMALTLYYPIAAVSRIAPSELEFRVKDNNQINDVKKLISQYAANNSVTYTQTDICKLTSSAKKLPMEYNIGTSKRNSDNENVSRTAGFECISYSQYISLLHVQGRDHNINQMHKLRGDECILVKYQPNDSGSNETAAFILWKSMVIKYCLR